MTNPYVIYFVLIPILCSATVLFSFTIGKVMGCREATMSHDAKAYEKHGLASH